MNRPTILVLSSTYPRWPQDSEPAFVHELNKRLTKKFKIITLAPAHPGARQEEVLDDVVVKRYRYCFDRVQTLCYNGGILPNIKKNPFKVILIPLLLISMILSLRKALKEYPIVLIHSHWIIPQGLALLTAVKLFKIKQKTILTSHGGDLFSLNATIFRWLKRHCIKSHDELCVVSKAMRTKAIELGAEPKRTSVMPMGVDLQYFFSPPENSAHRSGIIFVGRLVSKKGVKYLIEAVKQSKDLNTKLTIIGDGPERMFLENLCKQYDLSNKVNFLGRKPQIEVRNYLRKAAVAVFPSVETSSGDQEGLGLTIIEALGCNCKVIASDLPAIRDIAECTSLIQLVTPKDSIAIKEAIAQSLNLKPHQREDKIYKFDWENVTQNYSELYDKVLSS